MGVCGLAYGFLTALRALSKIDPTVLVVFDPIL